MASSAMLIRRPWTDAEDELLVTAVQKYGASRWSMIATSMSTGRVGKQCRERWTNHLSPEVNKRGWSAEEDEAIMHGVATLGSRWCEIVKSPLLSTRNDNAIKNRFHTLERNLKSKATKAAAAKASEAKAAAEKKKAAGPAEKIKDKKAAGPAEQSDESKAKAEQMERVMSLAVKLAFTTEEHDRDAIIELLTAASAYTNARRSTRPCGVDHLDAAVALPEALEAIPAEAFPEVFGSSAFHGKLDLASAIGEDLDLAPLLPTDVAAHTLTDFSEHCERAQCGEQGQGDQSGQGGQSGQHGQFSRRTGGFAEGLRVQLSETIPQRSIARGRLSTTPSVSSDTESNASTCLCEEPSASPATTTPTAASSNPSSVASPTAATSPQASSPRTCGRRLREDGAVAAPQDDDLAAADSPKRMRATSDGPCHLREPSMEAPSALATRSPLAPPPAHSLLKPTPLRTVAGTNELGTAALLASPSTAVTGTKEPSMACGMMRSDDALDFTNDRGMSMSELFVDFAEFADLFS